MRWNDLFNDLEGQLAAAHASEFEAGVRDLAQAERATVRLAERLASSLSSEVTLPLRGGTRVAGVVSDVTGAWVLLAEGPREQLIPIGSIAMAHGVSHRVTDLGVVASRLGLGHALRALARDGGPVAILTSSGQVRGRIDRVGYDHLDIATEEGGSVAIAFAAVLVIASSGAIFA